MPRSTARWLAAALLACACPSARAAPWVRQGGSAFGKLSASRFVADARDARFPERDAFEATSWTLQGEVGLSHGFELGLELPYTVATNTVGQRRYSNHSLADARLQLGYALLPSVPLAVGLELKTPLYRPVVAQAGSAFVELEGSSYPAVNFPDVGEGTVDLAPRVLLGRSLGAGGAWVTAEASYRLRLGPASDAVGLSGGLGGWVLPARLAVGMYASGAVNLKAPASPLERPLREWLYVSAYAFATATPWAPPLQVGLSAGSVVASNTATGTDLSLWVALAR